MVQGVAGLGLRRHKLARVTMQEVGCLVVVLPVHPCVLGSWGGPKPADSPSFVCAAHQGGPC